MAQGRGKGAGVAVGRGLRFAHPRLYSAALIPGGFATGAFAGLGYPLAVLLKAFELRLN